MMYLITLPVDFNDLILANVSALIWDLRMPVTLIIGLLLGVTILKILIQTFWQR